MKCRPTAAHMNSATEPSIITSDTGTLNHWIQSKLKTAKKYITALLLCASIVTVSILAYSQLQS